MMIHDILKIKYVQLGYIKKNYPIWYEQLYGNKTPEEALHAKNGCLERAERDPEELHYCYDDEDK